MAILQPAVKSLPNLKNARNIHGVFNGIKKKGKQLLPCCGETFHILTYHCMSLSFKGQNDYSLGLLLESDAL